MRFRAGFLSILLIASASLGFRAPERTQVSDPGKPLLGGTLRVKTMPGIAISVSSLDPTESVASFILDELYDGLVRLDKNFNLIPALAEYWVISDSGRKFTFFLRKGAKFHHGREVTAEDVKFSLERLLRKGNGTLYFQSFKGKVVGAAEFADGRASEVKGFRAINRSTFEIEWENPYSAGLLLLSMDYCKVLPRELVIAQGQSFFMRPSGTGPFKFGSWMRSPRLGIEGVRLERNDEYFGEPPYIDAVEFSPHFSMEQFLSGEVHIIPFSEEDSVPERFGVLESDSLNFVFLGLSCDVPPLNRADVRRALALILDKDKIAQAAQSTGNFPKAFDDYVPAELPGILPLESDQRPDPEKAAALLAAAGFGPSRPFPEIVFRIPWPRNDIYMRIYRELRRQLEALDIRLEYEYVRSLREERPKSRPYLQIFDWIMDFPDAENIVLPLFQSESFLNTAIMGFSDPVLDGLLAESEVEPGWERRTALFRQMARLLRDSVPAIPLYRIRSRIAMQPNVRGARVSPMGFNNLDVRDIWFDE